MAVGHAFLCSAMKTLLILFLLRFAHNYVWNFEYLFQDNAMMFMGQIVLPNFSRFALSLMVAEIDHVMFMHTKRKLTYIHA